MMVRTRRRPPLQASITNVAIAAMIGFWSSLTSFDAAGHEIRPAIVTADVTAPGRFTITAAVNIEAILADIGAEHKDTNDAPGAAQYNQLRALPRDELRARFSAFMQDWLKDIKIAFDGRAMSATLDGMEIPEGIDLSLARISTIRLSGATPVDAKSFEWSYPARFGTNVLRVKRSGTAELETTWLKNGDTSAEIPLIAGERRSTLSMFAEYVGLGFTHILPMGLDHILFVLGLFLLSAQLRPLLVQVTAFTVAHSTTLALGLYGFITVSPAIVEPMIALSIVFVAVENLCMTRLSVWRPFIVFGFGLLHGLGFAGVLHELGLPRDQYITGLLGFNVGVEAGQLAVITLAFFTTAYWFRHEVWYRQRIVCPASAMIALTGAFWTVERIWFT